MHKAGPGDLTFVANARYLPKLATTRASAVILGRATADARLVSCAVLHSDDPYSAFAHAVALFAPDNPPATGIDPLSAVASDAVIGADASIGPFVTVGAGAAIGARTIVHPNVVVGAGARIGDDCVIHAQVSIRDRVVIGDRVTLHDGAVVGSDGYGFARQKDGTHLKIPQHGDVVIEDDVEIGANTTIDRPAIGETRIGAGTKIDNLVHVAHGVAIGRRVLLAAQVGHRRQHDDRRRRDDGGADRRHRTHHRWRQGRGRREERGAAIRGGRRVRHRLTGVSTRGLAEGVGGIPPPAVDEETP